MKFFHLSDLHIGRQLHHYSLLEDQRHILREVVGYARSHQPDAIVIAGDVYDKSVPSAEAVSLLDDFLTELSEMTPRVAVLLIAGNHDSAKRLEYAGRIMERQNLFFAGEVPTEKDQYLKKVTLSDEYGQVDFYLLPFLKPGYVRGVFEEKIPESYSEAVECMLMRERVDTKKRNVLISHQFYTGKGQSPQTCDSENFSVGGIDNVDIGPLRQFEYAALGHIHGAQQVAQPSVRYCGTLLKYSVSEAGHNKSLHIVELGEKGNEARISRLPLHPLRDVRVLRGELQQLIEEAKQENRDDYVSITLTDELDPYRPKDQLEKVYSHILEIRVDNTRTRQRLAIQEHAVEIKDPFTVFGQFYHEIQDRDLSVRETVFLKDILDRLKGDSHAAD